MVIFLSSLRMDMNALLDKCLETPAAEKPAAEQPTADDAEKRERLADIAAGGLSKRYLGRVLTPEQIDTMTPDEIEKLYARYSMRLGAAMTQTLGKATLQLYAEIVSWYLPIDSPSRLVADLETDPFVEHALSAATCQTYHKFGMYLAPLTAALTTMRHCRFGHVCPRTVSEDGGQDGDSSGSDQPGIDTSDSSYQRS